MWEKSVLNGIGAGMIKNLTLIAEEPDEHVVGTHGYAIHVENNSLSNKTLFIENCILENYTNYALGMGLRGGCDVEIRDCEIKSHDNYAPIYFHDASNQTYSGEQNIKFINCQAFNIEGGSLMRVDSQDVTDSVVNVTFNNCLLRDTTDIKNTTITAQNLGTSGDIGWLGLYHFVLTSDSYGNSIGALNYQGGVISLTPITVTLASILAGTNAYFNLSGAGTSGDHYIITPKNNVNHALNYYTITAVEPEADTYIDIKQSSVNQSKCMVKYIHSGLFTTYHIYLSVLNCEGAVRPRCINNAGTLTFSVAHIEHSTLFSAVVDVNSPEMYFTTVTV